MVYKESDSVRIIPTGVYASYPYPHVGSVFSAEGTRTIALHLGTLGQKNPLMQNEFFALLKQSDNFQKGGLKALLYRRAHNLTIVLDFFIEKEDHA